MATKLPFSDQTAIITGAGMGIGKEIAGQLLMQGAFVVVNDANQEVLGGLPETWDTYKGRFATVAGNAGDPQVIEEMMLTAQQYNGRLDIVIANAGITTFGSFLDYTADQFQALMDLNLKGSFFLAQAGARRMKAQGSGGRILFMSSVTGHQAHEYLVAYGMTKAALEMLAKGLVVELSAFGITVNAIAPGATITERTLKDDPNYNKTWEAITPMGRPATTKDIAHAALFLVSPLSGHITGQTLVVDGGWTSVSPGPDTVRWA